MAIREETFDDERELETWVRNNIGDFVPGSLLLPGRQISTVSGKGGIPDGFLFDLAQHQWYVLEAELLRHGVWPHIAEQIVRFAVAVQNPLTRRSIRDHLFEAIVERDLVKMACESLETTRECLLQEIELFVEGTEPQIIIFIDETNQDLTDLVNALSLDTLVYRVKKYVVNDTVEYSSPDNHLPRIVAEQTPSSSSAAGEYDVVERLGGGELAGSAGRFKAYKMRDGSIVHIKRSKYYPRHEYYWYGITPSELDTAQEMGVTHFVFVMAEHGFARVPLDVVARFVQTTRTTKNKDGSVRHYHCLISPPPDHVLYFSQELPSYELSDFYQSF